ncbi:MAG TPA: hypothetical protein VIK49_09710 [Steroidobacteraceae bacterium]
MRRGGFMAVCLLAWPAAAADKPAEPPDPEFLEYLAEFTDDDQDFSSYIESSRGERELKRAEKEAAKEDDDE